RPSCLPTARRTGSHSRRTFQCCPLFRFSSCGPNKTSFKANCSLRSGIRIADSRSEKAMTDSARSKDSYISLRYQPEDSEKATKLFESPSPESVVAASGEGPDL